MNRSALLIGVCGLAWAACGGPDVPPYNPAAGGDGGASSVSDGGTPPPASPPVTHRDGGPSSTPSDGGFVDTGLRPSGRIADLWNALGGPQGGLGYPVSAPVADTECARQHFSKGYMFWVENRASNPDCFESCPLPARIFVAVMPQAGATSGTTSYSFPDEWPGQPHHWCAEAQANGSKGPVRGFGKVWCEQSAARPAVGEPLDVEVGGAQYPKCASQLFQGGIVLHDALESQHWVILAGGRWHRFSP